MYLDFEGYGPATYPKKPVYDWEFSILVKQQVEPEQFREKAQQIGIRPTSLCRVYHGYKPSSEVREKINAWLISLQQLSK